MKHPPRLRVIAIDPSPRGFGFAVLDGPSRLAEWGLAYVHGDKNAESIRRLADLVAVYSPQVLVVEDCGASSCRRRPRIRTLIADMVTYGELNGIEVREVGWSQVREATGLGSRSVKEQIAHALVRIFPELTDRLPPHRKSWMNEDPRRSLFDAVGLAVAAFVEPQAPGQDQGA